MSNAQSLCIMHCALIFMANPLRSPILGSFEDIGEQVVNQVKQLPKDVGQAALESIGMSTGGNKQSGQATVQTAKTDSGGDNPLRQMEQAKTDREKKQLAQAALQWLAQPGESGAKPPEKSIWEKIQEEEAQKKEMKAQQQKSQASALPMPTGKPKRGSMYGAKQKQTSTENKATKSD
jgi:hypothetical protein